MKNALIALLAAWLLLPASAPRAHPDPGGLELGSVHAAVAVLGEEELLLDKHAGRTVPIASLTKLMTALVVAESGESLDEWLEVRDYDEPMVKNAYSRIRVGSRLQRGELLRLALMSSENLASHVLASHHPGGREAFVEAMNARARSLGMHDTRFVDPSGLSPENRSTARDLLRLVTAVHERPDLRAYSVTPVHTANFQGPRYRLGYGNTNPLVHRDAWSISLSKTGYLTEAGRCLAMVTEINGRPHAVVLLDAFGTRTPIGDAGRIRRWLETGEGGSVAGPARDYEQRRSAEYRSDSAGDG